MLSTGRISAEPSRGEGEGEGRGPENEKKREREKEDPEGVSVPRRRSSRMEKQFFEGKEKVLHSFDLDFLRGVNLEALYYNIIAYIYIRFFEEPKPRDSIELESRKEEIEEMEKKKKEKEKFLLAPREQKEEFICVLLTHNSSRSSFLVAIFERGNRGDQASIRP